MRENLHLIENISLFTEVNKQIFAKIISKLKSHNKITIKDLAITLKGIMGYEGQIIFNPEHPDGQPRRCLDTSAAYRVMGFESQIDLYSGLKETVSWYYRHREEMGYCDYFDHIQ